jgi:hypothetical protein
MKMRRRARLALASADGNRWRLAQPPAVSLPRPDIHSGAVGIQDVHSMHLQPMVNDAGGVHGLGVHCMRRHFWRGTTAAAAIIAFAATVMAADDKSATEKKVEKKPPSVCVGLDITACGAKTECFWKQQITTKQGKTRKAHCRLKPRQQMAKKAV